MSIINKTGYIKVRKLAGWKGSVIIAGKNTGIDAIITRHFDETLGIVDFLNKCLREEYFTAYFDVLIKCNNKLETGTIFELDYPKIPTVYAPISKDTYKGADSDDAALVETLLDDYYEKAIGMKIKVAQWGEVIEKWFRTQEDNREEVTEKTEKREAE